MQTRRTFLPSAVFAHAVPAGTIASRNGSAIVTPIPLRTVRRDRAFFVRYMSKLLLSGGGRHGIGRAHLERGAVDDAEDERGEPVAVGGGLAHDGAHRRLIEVLDAAADRVRHQVAGEGADHRG